MSGDAPVEVTCDESGFTGGNLTAAHGVFVHASLQVSTTAAAREMVRLRQRVAAPGELKASWLLRWATPDDLQRLLDPDGLLSGGVLVQLVDTRLFLLARLTDVLLGPTPLPPTPLPPTPLPPTPLPPTPLPPTWGLELPGADPTARAAAFLLHRAGEPTFGPDRWLDFLTSAGHTLRPTGRWVPASAVDDFDRTVTELIDVSAQSAELRDTLRRLRAASDRVRAVRRQLETDPSSPPLAEPLLPTVAHAALGWGATRPDIVLVHDEQSGLTPQRVALMASLLSDRHPGHRLSVRRVDSRDDPRIQVADLVAGIVRRAAVGVLQRSPVAALTSRVAALVDPASLWAETSWPGRRPSGPGDR